MNVEKLRPDQNTEPEISGGYVLAWDVGAGTYLPTWKSIQVKRPFPKPGDYITITSTTYPEQISALKRFLHQRAEWMDANLARVTP